MMIEIPDDLNQRLINVANRTGQDAGVLACQAIEQHLVIEERKARQQDVSDWQSFSDQDPFVAMIGSLKDDTADVSQDKYGYLADAYDRP